MKIFDKANSEYESKINELRAEIEVMLNTKHDNIVNMKEFSEEGVWQKTSGKTKQITYVVMEELRP